MNTLKKVAALVGLMSLASLSHAAIVAAPAPAGSGNQIYEIGVSTPASTVLWLATGAGNLNSVVIDSGTAGGGAYFVAFDSATAGGAYLPTSDGTAAAPRLGGVYLTTTLTPAQMVGPSRSFKNGLKVVVGPACPCRGSINLSN